MGKFIKGASLALALSLSLGGIASAAGTLTADEFKAQAAFGKAGAKFTDAKTKCVSKCIATAVKLATPQANCLAPAYADAAVNLCIFDAVKGAEAKAQAAMVKAGLKDCPECYSGGNCSAQAATIVAALESQIDPFGPLVFCDPAPVAATTLKCELAVSKSLTKYVAARQKCYDKCQANAFKGIGTASACLPPATDAATIACLSDPVKGTEAKTALAIDKACTLKASNPACYVPSFDTGAEWASLVAVAIDGNQATTYCGSASGAFLQ